MNIKQFKKRWLHSKIEPEMFYLPVGKKEEKFGRIQIRFVTSLYVGADKYRDEIVGTINQNSPYFQLKDVMVAEVCFLNEKMNVLFKCSAVTQIDIKNIPYGTYYIKILKIRGYKMIEDNVKIVVNDTFAIQNVVFYPAYIKRIYQIENIPVDYAIKEGGRITYAYGQATDILSETSDKIISVQQSNTTIATLFYDYNDNYLGKIYITGNLGNSANIQMGSSYLQSSSTTGLVCFKYPTLALNYTTLTSKQFTYSGGRHNYYCEIQSTSFQINKAPFQVIPLDAQVRGLINIEKANSTVRILGSRRFKPSEPNSPQPPDDDGTYIGDNIYLNKAFDYYDNPFTSESEFENGDWNVYMPTGFDKLTGQYNGETVKIGEKIYLHDGMTKELLKDIFYGQVKLQSLYKRTDIDNFSTIKLYYPPEMVLDNDDMTLSVYNSRFISFCEDYELYTSIEETKTSPYIDYSNVVKLK